MFVAFLGRVVLGCVVAALTFPPLSAQTPSSSGTSDAALGLPRADASAAAGWFSATLTYPEGTRPDGDSWYHDAASFSAHAGYYWTENLKVEASAAWAGTGRAWSGTQRVDPGGRVYYSSTEHTVITRTVSAALVYQFGRNQMVHPFVGAGVDLDFERESRLTTSYGEPVALFPPPNEARVDRTRARLLLVAGAKAYVGERVFVRADLQASGAGRARKVVPRVGLGIDF